MSCRTWTFYIWLKVHSATAACRHKPPRLVNCDPEDDPSVSSKPLRGTKRYCRGGNKFVAPVPRLWAGHPHLPSGPALQPRRGKQLDSNVQRGRLCRDRTLARQTEPRLRVLAERGGSKRDELQRRLDGERDLACRAARRTDLARWGLGAADQIQPHPVRCQCGSNLRGEPLPLARFFEDMEAAAVEHELERTAGWRRRQSCGLGSEQVTCSSDGKSPVACRTGSTAARDWRH